MTFYTRADRARMTAAVADHDKRRALQRSRDRLARLAYFAGSAVVLVAFFYRLTN